MLNSSGPWRNLRGFGLAITLFGTQFLAAQERTWETVSIAACFGGTNRYSLEVSEKSLYYDSSSPDCRTLYLRLRTPEVDERDLPVRSDFQAGRDVQLHTIVRLYLSGQSLTKGDWARLRRLTNLNAIRIVDCQLADDDFQMLAAFPKLEDLRINGIAIGAQGIRTLAKCPKLEQLSLGRYVISPMGRRPRPFLQSCQLDSPAIDELLKLESMRALNLSRIRLTLDQLEGLRRMPQLEVLDVRDCGLTDVSLKIFYGAKTLRQLWLRDEVTLFDDNDGIVPCPCDVTPRAAMDFLTHNPTCKLFYFYDPTLDDITSQAGFEKQLSRWKRERNNNDRLIVDLRYSRITEEGLSWVARVPDIAALDIAGRDITDVGVDSIRQMKSLRELHIYGTKISAEGLKTLKDLQQLEDVWIDAAQFESKAARDALKALRAGARIIVITDNDSQRDQALKWVSEFTEQTVIVPRLGQ